MCLEALTARSEADLIALRAHPSRETGVRLKRAKTAAGTPRKRVPQLILFSHEARVCASRRVHISFSTGRYGDLMPDYSMTASQILHPARLARTVDANTAPKEKGIYAWLFAPGSLPVPDAEYATTDGFELLYVGIAPSSAASKSLLRPRLVRHATGDASRSTLRLTLGVLLADELGLTLGIHKERVNWGPDGEAKLSRWMSEHARVAWAVHSEPWTVENELLATATLALNIDGRSDAFSRELKHRRTQARRAARAAG